MLCCGFTTEDHLAAYLRIIHEEKTFQINKQVWVDSNKRLNNWNSWQSCFNRIIWLFVQLQFSFIHQFPGRIQNAIKKKQKWKAKEKNRWINLFINTNVYKFNYSLFLFYSNISLSLALLTAQINTNAPVKVNCMFWQNKLLTKW